MSVESTVHKFLGKYLHRVMSLPPLSRRRSAFRVGQWGIALIPLTPGSLSRSSWKRTSVYGGIQEPSARFGAALRLRIPL